MDNDAVELDDAIQRVLNGDAAAARHVRRIRAQVLARLNRRLLAGGDVSLGANQLLSAATDAGIAARNDDLRRLVNARRLVTEARAKLADEVSGR